MKKNYSDPTQAEMHAFTPCPTCKNDNVDTLLWEDPENMEGYVTCLACGTQFAPHNSELPVKPKTGIN